MFVGNESIAGFDDEMAQAIEAETLRQEQHIELIASENYASPRVMQAQGGVLTNKYAEGYPHKRYYGGCEHVDKVDDPDTPLHTVTHWVRVRGRVWGKGRGQG